eukprot:g68573.t1
MLRDRRTEFCQSTCTNKQSLSRAFDLTTSRSPFHVTPVHQEQKAPPVSSKTLLASLSSDLENFSATWLLLCYTK